MKKLLIALSIGVALPVSVLAYQTNTDQHQPHYNYDGTQRFSEKTIETSPDCYYRHEAPPLSTKVSTNNAFLDMQYIAFSMGPNGSTKRMVATPKFQKALDAAENENRFVDWLDMLENAGSGDFRPAPKSMLNTRVGKKKGRAPDPLDFELSWYSKLAFVVIGDDVRFDNANPINILSGGQISPFYGPADVRNNGQMFTVDYLNMPVRDYLEFEGIAERDCIYTYELNLEADSKVNGAPFTTKIIIDPGGTNDGGPGEGEPPGGGGWPP